MLKKRDGRTNGQTNMHLGTVYEKFDLIKKKKFFFGKKILNMWLRENFWLPMFGPRQKIHQEDTNVFYKSHTSHKIDKVFMFKRPYL